jgi:hypothetical protein
VALTVVLSSLPANDPFIAGKTQLREAIAGSEVLLITAVYMLPPLRGWLPVFKF